MQLQGLIWIDVRSGQRYVLESWNRRGIYLSLLGRHQEEILVDPEEFYYCYNPWFESLEFTS